MSKFAVIKTGGKQYKIAEGDKIKIEKIEDKKGSKINIEEVLLISDNDKLKIGKPHIKDAKIDAKIIDHGKREKIRIIKFKPKKRYKRHAGHRQNYTEIEVKEINY